MPVVLNLLMKPAARHDIALLFARCFALFTLYEPFIAVCSFIVGEASSIVFGGSLLMSHSKRLVLPAL